MIDFRPIFFVIGVLLATLAIVMFVPAIVDLIVGEPDWQVFGAASGLTLFIGVSLALMNRAAGGRINVRQAFVLTTMSWVVLTGFAALPFAFSGLGLSFTDSFFEAMSGITITGATVMVGRRTAIPRTRNDAD